MRTRVMGFIWFLVMWLAFIKSMGVPTYQALPASIAASTALTLVIPEPRRRKVVRRRKVTYYEEVEEVVEEC